MILFHDLIGGALYRQPEVIDFNPPMLPGFFVSHTEEEMKLRTDVKLMKPLLVGFSYMPKLRKDDSFLSNRHAELQHWLE